MRSRTLSAFAFGLVLMHMAALGMSAEMRFPSPATVPDHGWEACAPEEELVNSTKLQNAMQFLKDALDDPMTPDAVEDGIRFACVIRNGRMIWPNTVTPDGQGDDLGTPCHVYSCTKGFGTGVLGILVDQGLVSLDSRANSIVDVDLSQKGYSSYNSITLRHLATFTDGYADKRPKWPEAGMYYPFEPQSPMFTPPGSKYAYNSSPQLLAYCLTKIIANRFSQPPYSWPAEKCNLDSFFEWAVATKIGMARDGWRWSDEFPDPGQHFIDLSNSEGLDIRPISQSMFITAGAMARWGHLFLNRGTWQGCPVISRAYVDAATTVQVAKEIEPHNRAAGYREAPGRYGYMWWINGPGGWTREGLNDPPQLMWQDVPERTGPSTGCYAAHGWQSNRCWVIHTLNTPFGEARADMVVVRLSHGGALGGRDSTPGRFTSEEANDFLRLLGESLVPAPKDGRPE